MKQLFHVDGPIMTFMSQIANFIILSVLWLLCCIPVITIGASTSALYYVTLKMVRGEISGVAGPFFKALKANLRAGIVFSLLFGVMGAVLYLDYTVMLQQTGTLGTVFRVIFMVLGFFSLITMFYTFPLQAQFVNTVRGTLKNAFYFSIGNIRTTLVVLAFHAIPLLLIFLPLQTLFKILPLVFLILPGLIAYLCSVQFMKIFKPLMENIEEKNPTETEL